MKIIFKAAAALVASAMLFACGAQKPADKPADKPAAPVKLEFYIYKQEINETLPALIKAFTAVNKHVTIETLLVPNDQNKTLTTRANAGKLPDLIQMQSYAQVKQFAKAGYLADLTAEPVLAKVIDSAKPAVTAEGKLYALPMDFAGIGIIYNKTIFAKYNLTPPTTYTELQQVAATLKKNGVTPFAGLLKENWSIGHFITLVHTALLGAKGGNAAIDKFVADMDTKATSYGTAVDFNKVLSVIDFYKSNMDPKAAEMNWDEQQASFANEKAAMMVQGLWSFSPAIKSNPKLDAGFIPFPVTDVATETKFYADVDSTIGVSAQSSADKQAAAKLFLNWLSSPEAVKIWTTELKLTVSFKGADLSGMEGPFQALMTTVAEKGAYPWAFSNYPNPTWEGAVKIAAHGYALGTKKKAEVIAEIDKSWADELAKAAAPATEGKK